METPLRIQSTRVVRRGLLPHRGRLRQCWQSPVTVPARRFSRYHRPQMRVPRTVPQTVPEDGPIWHCKQRLPHFLLLHQRPRYHLQSGWKTWLLLIVFTAAYSLEYKTRGSGPVPLRLEAFLPAHELQLGGGFAARSFFCRVQSKNFLIAWTRRLTLAAPAAFQCAAGADGSGRDRPR